MKRFTLLFAVLVLFVLFTSPCAAQKLAENRSYWTVSLHTDTTSWGAVNDDDKTLFIRFKDTVNVRVFMDYKRDYEDMQVKVDTLIADSTNSTTAWGLFYSWVLRTNYTNEIPCAQFVRLRVECLSTKNNVSTPYYDAEMVEH